MPNHSVIQMIHLRGKNFKIFFSFFPKKDVNGIYIEERERRREGEKRRERERERCPLSAGSLPNGSNNWSSAGPVRNQEPLPGPSVGARAQSFEQFSAAFLGLTQGMDWKWSSWDPICSLVGCWPCGRKLSLLCLSTSPES